jgi:hypothetical protein
MNTLILQIIIKQWDKSQRTELHTSERANRPDRYPIILPPAFYAFNEQCLIDLHGDDRQGNRVTYCLTADKKIRLDRFQICTTNNTLEYSDTSKPNPDSQSIGSLDNNWIQARYNWRYSVFEDEMYYWLYEEVTLNAIAVDAINKNVFLETAPALIFENLTLAI